MAGTPETFDPWAQPARKRKKRSSTLPLLALFLAAAVAFSVCREGIGRVLEGKPFHRLPSVPRELEEHTFLQSREIGPCGLFRGEVGIAAIFVQDGESGWTEEEMESCLQQLNGELPRITQDARSRGIELTLTLRDRQCQIAQTVSAENTDASLDILLEAAGLPADGFHDKLEAELGTDQAAVVFLLNKPGRASAMMGSLEEYCFLFDDLSAFRHELYHLFGAEDLYYPEEVTDIAESCFGTSIMLGYESVTVDDLTAYLMGWTDELSDSALSFLEQTAWVTRETLRDAYDEEALTGYGTREYEDATYTGQLKMGVPHGWGTLVMDDGAVYEGGFDNGLRHGNGTYRWSNGDVYSGPFVNDVRTGYATFTWSNGDKFEGNFQEDVRTGFGIYTWADGSRYEGDFYQDAITGSGTLYWTDGSSFTGEFLNGAMEGWGTLTYPDGRTLSGNWHNNDYYGK